MDEFAPVPNLVVEDSRKIKAFADPLRVRLLVVLAERAATNQQLADTLEEPQAKVLYHLRFLLDVGLIRLVETRVTGGNVEKYYRAVARTYELRPSLELRAEIVSAELAAISRDLTASAAHHPGQQRLLARARRLTPEQVDAFYERVIALADEFWLAGDDGEGDEHTFALFVYRNPRDNA